MAEGNSGWSWGWRGRIAFLVLGLWCLLAALAAFGVGLGGLTAALPWLLIIAGICLIVGV